MDKILLTGFQPFGCYNENITQRVIQETSILNYHSVENFIFPVRIFEGKANSFGYQVVSKAMEIKARAIISLGMASDVRGVRVESRAVNWSEHEKYCLPIERKRVLYEDLAPKHPLEVDLNRWKLDDFFSELSFAEIEHEKNVSKNAHSFCCNALMFRTLYAAKQLNCKIPYIFLHFPCSPKSVIGMPKDARQRYLTSLPKVQTILEILSSTYVS